MCCSSSTGTTTITTVLAVLTCAATSYKLRRASRTTSKRETNAVSGENLYDSIYLILPSSAKTLLSSMVHAFEAQLFAV